MIIFPFFSIFTCHRFRKKFRHSCSSGNTHKRAIRRETNIEPENPIDPQPTKVGCAQTKERKFEKQILRLRFAREHQRRRCSPTTVGIWKYENSIRSVDSVTHRIGWVAVRWARANCYFFYRNRATESFPLFLLVRATVVAIFQLCSPRAEEWEKR